MLFVLVCFVWLLVCAHCRCCCYRHCCCSVDARTLAVVSIRIDSTLVDAAVGFDAVHVGVFVVVAGSVARPKRKKYAVAFGGFWF